MCEAEGKNASVRFFGEPPCRTRNLPVWPILPVLHQQPGLRFVDVGCWIRLVDAVRQQPRPLRRVGPDLHQHLPRRRLPVLEGHGSLEAHHRRTTRDIPLPPDRQHRVTPAAEETVAEGDLRRSHARRRRQVEGRHHLPPPPVHDVDQQFAVAALPVDRCDEREIAREAHETVGAAPRQREVGDESVRRVRGVDGVGQQPVDTLVWAGFAGFRAVGEGRAFRDFDADDGHAATPPRRRRSPRRRRPSTGASAGTNSAPPWRR